MRQLCDLVGVFIRRAVPYLGTYLLCRAVEGNRYLAVSVAERENYAVSCGFLGELNSRIGGGKFVCRCGNAVVNIEEKQVVASL